MRASGVFTGTTNSPSRRQDSRSIIPPFVAGRNLPDKEFRSVSPTLFPEKPDFIFASCVHLLKPISRISSMPSAFRWFSLIDQVQNLSELAKSTRFLDLSECFSKKGTILSAR